MPQPCHEPASPNSRQAAASSSQNSRASSRAASSAKRRSSVSSGRVVVRALLRAAGQHALDHAALEPRRPADLAACPFSCIAERGRRRPDTGTPAGRRGRTAREARRCASWTSCATRPSGKLGQLGQRLLEQMILPDSSERSTRPAVSWPVSRRCVDQRPHLADAASPPRARRSPSRRPPARSARRGPHRASSRATTKPASVSDSFGDQRLARRGRQIVARQQRLADRREMAEALHDAVERERRDVAASDFRSGSDRLRREPTSAIAAATARWQPGRPRDRGLHCRTRRPTQSTRSESSSSGERARHDRGDIRLIGRQRMHDGRRRILARRECLRERDAHQRRRIVEQHDHRAFGGGAIVRRQIGIEIGARERAGGLGALAGRRGSHPLEEVPNDHGRHRLTLATHGQASRAARDTGNTINAVSARLTKRSP